MTDPIKTLRCLVLDSIEGTLDCGMDMSSRTDTQDFKSTIEDLYGALAFLEQAVSISHAERQALLLLLEFHNGLSGTGEPFDVRAAESAWAKLKG